MTAGIFTKIIRIPMASCFAALCIAGAKAQEIEYVGSCYMGGSFHSIEVNGSLAYCAMQRGFQILDIADPDSVRLVGGISLIHAQELRLSGNYAYVTAGTLEEPRFGLIDIQNPERPTIIATLNGVGYWPMAISGHYVYIINESDGFDIIDVSDPFSPAVVGNYTNAGDNHDIFVSGSYLYLAAGEDGLEIVDISNPVEPQLVVGYVSPLGGGSWEIFVEGPYAYMKSGEGSIFEIADISDPSNPAYMGHIDFGYREIRGIFVEDSFIYAFEDSGLDFAWTLIINGLDPENPFVEYLGMIFPGGELWYDLLSIHVDGNIAYHTFRDWLTVVDVSTPSSPAVVGEFTSRHWLSHVKVSGDYSFGLGGGGVFAFDVTDRMMPEMVSNYSVGSLGRDIALAGDYAFVAEMGFEIIDFTTPESPVFVGQYEGGHEYCIDVQGNYVYLTGIRIVDISDPAEPVLVGEYPVGTAWDIFVKDSLAFVPKVDGGLVIVDVSNPEDPVPLGSCETPYWTISVHAQGQYAYVGTAESGVFIIDVSDPGNPFQVAHYETPGSVWDIYVENNYGYIADRDSGIVLIDISDPLDPAYVACYDTPGLPTSVDVDGQYIYVGDDYSLMILRFTPGPCEYVPGDCDHNGMPLELGDVTAMIGNYRGIVAPYYICDCGVDPPGSRFAATADPDGNCVPNEHSDVVTEIAAYRGLAEASGCPDCPGSRR